LERCATLFHPLHIVVVGQDLAGGGVYVYVTNGTARRVGEGGYDSIETPDRLALRLSQERMGGHHHIAHSLDQPAVGFAMGRMLIYRRADVLAEEVGGKIGHLLDDRRR
jgi:hypothetical protein